VDRMNARARTILRDGRPRKGVWKALVEDVLLELGGRATLTQITMRSRHADPPKTNGGERRFGRNFSGVLRTAGLVNGLFWR
jgi:hypothetical protein